MKRLTLASFALLAVASLGTMGCSGGYRYHYRARYARPCGLYARGAVVYAAPAPPAVPAVAEVAPPPPAPPPVPAVPAGPGTVYVHAHVPGTTVIVINPAPGGPAVAHRTAPPAPEVAPPEAPVQPAAPPAQPESPNGWFEDD